MVAGISVASDYIVVGAGSSGSVIVRRLLETGHSVHVIEAGPKDTDPAIHSLQGFTTLLGGSLDWGLFTVPQKHANNRRIFWPRGKVLGGSSSLNAMLYVRGHASDYESWARQSGDRGWSWANTLPLFKRSEAHECGATRVHGGRGPQSVSRITRPHQLSVAFVEAALTLGNKFVSDFNDGETLGVGYADLTTRGDERMSSWKSFVTPICHHPKLLVTTNALVHRVLIAKGTAFGVEYTQGHSSMRAYAESEVVLSAGVIGSPKILLLSGIGPAAHVESTGVKPVLDLPGVGENLHDHPLVSLTFESNEPVSLPMNYLLEAQVFNYSSECNGRAPDLQSALLLFPLPAEGDRVPDHGYTIAAGVVAPRSRGALRLASADPTDMPLADPNMLADPADLEAMVDAVEICREIGASESFAPWRRAEVAPGSSATTRDDLRAFVRRTVMTYHHQVGTCMMGAHDDPNSVVGPDLRVRGIDGLRVADASIMPNVTSGNTHAPSMMIGERASDLILGG
jgi:choline dehydrogenase